MAKQQEFKTTTKGKAVVQGKTGSLQRAETAMKGGGYRAALEQSREQKKNNESPAVRGYGDFVLSTGGGEPIPRGGKMTTEKRVLQPRDEDGKFTYNAVSAMPLKYKKSRGTTKPPTFKAVVEELGDKMGFIFDPTTYEAVKNGKVMETKEFADLNVEKLIEDLKVYCPGIKFEKGQSFEEVMLGNLGEREDSYQEAEFETTTQERVKQGRHSKEAQQMIDEGKEGEIEDTRRDGSYNTRFTITDPDTGIEKETSAAELYDEIADELTMPKTKANREKIAKMIREGNITQRELAKKLGSEEKALAVMNHARNSWKENRLTEKYIDEGMSEEEARDKAANEMIDKRLSQDYLEEGVEYEKQRDFRNRLKSDPNAKYDTESKDDVVDEKDDKQEIGVEEQKEQKPSKEEIGLKSFDDYEDEQKFYDDVISVAGISEDEMDDLFNDADKDEELQKKLESANTVQEFVDIIEEHKAKKLFGLNKKGGNN